MGINERTHPIVKLYPLDVFQADRDKTLQESTELVKHPQVLLDSSLSSRICPQMKAAVKAPQKMSQWATLFSQALEVIVTLEKKSISKRREVGKLAKHLSHYCSVLKFCNP